jgi:hypothetical protein
MPGYDKAHINSIPLRIAVGPSGADTLVVIQQFSPLGSHAQVTSLSTVYTANPPENCIRSLVQASVQDVRFRLDGGSPTSSLGFLLRAGSPPIILPCQPGQTIKFIEVVAGAVLDLQFGY